MLEADKIFSLERAKRGAKIGAVTVGLVMPLIGTLPGSYFYRKKYAP